LQDLREFFLIFNGLLLNSEVWTHHCRGCCKSSKDFRERMTNVVRKIMLRSPPAVPTLNKWTKLGACIDFIVLGLTVHNVLVALFLKGMAEIVPSKDRVLESVVDDDVDEELRRALNWSAVNGARFKASRAFLLDPLTQFKVRSLALVLEVTRYISGWFIRRAREVEAPCAQPALFDLLHEGYSPMQSSLQYLASMLAGVARRLVIIWHPRGCSSLQDWFDRCKQEVRKLRQLILHMSAGIYRRHVKSYRQHFAVAMADARKSMAARLAIATEYLRTSFCCLRCGLWRRLAAILRQSGKTAADLLGAGFQLFLFHVARLATCQIADVEWRHSRNRARSHKYGQSRYRQFIADAVNAEAKVLHQARLDRAVMEEALLVRPGGLMEEKKGKESKKNKKQKESETYGRLRARTPLALYHHECAQQAKAMGRRANPASEPFWREVKQEFEKLDTAKLSLLRAQSVAEKDSAKEARAAKQRSENTGPATSAILADVVAQPALEHSTAIVPVQAPNCTCAHGAHPGTVAVLLPASADLVEDNQAPADVPPNALTLCHKSRLDVNSTVRKDDRPLSNDLLEALLEQRDGEGRQYSVKRGAEIFTLWVEEASGAHRTDAGFPKTVQYPVCCKAMCVNAVQADVFKMYKDLQAALTRIVKKVGPAKDIATYDVVLAVVSCLRPEAGEEGRKEVLFFGLYNAASKWSHPNPEEVLTQLECTDAESKPIGVDFSGLTLRYRYAAFVQPLKRARAPLHQQTVGPLVQYTQDEFALHILREFGGDDFRSVKKVSFYKLTFDDIDLETIETTGVDEAFPVEVVEFPGGQQVSEVPALEDVPTPTSRGPCGSADLPNDFVDFTVDDEPSPKRQQRSQPIKSEPSLRSAGPIFHTTEKEVLELLGELGINEDGVAEESVEAKSGVAHQEQELLDCFAGDLGTGDELLGMLKEFTDCVKAELSDDDAEDEEEEGPAKDKTAAKNKTAAKARTEEGPDRRRRPGQKEKPARKARRPAEAAKAEPAAKADAAAKRAPADVELVFPKIGRLAWYKSKKGEGGRFGAYCSHGSTCKKERTGSLDFCYWWLQRRSYWTCSAGGCSRGGCACSDLHMMDDAPTEEELRDAREQLCAVEGSAALLAKEG